MNSCTKGPWEIASHNKPQDDCWAVDYDDEEGLFADWGSQGIFEENGEAVCFVVSVPYDSEKMEKRARLIAAAPELAEVLQAFVFALDLTDMSIGPSANEVLALRAHARAALAKAGAA